MLSSNHVQGSGQQQCAINAGHSFQRAECFPTVSEVRQQDLGWVAGGPNDYSPDSGDSQ